jgi:thiol:disulfide interchange protein
MKIVLIALMLVVSLTGSASAQRPKVRQGLYFLTATYDPARNAADDLKQAVAKAQESGKRILLDVGGEWCIWCHILDDFLARNTVVGDAFAASFVILKIDWSPDDKNEAFLSAYPEAPGYPHFYVLDSDGKLLRSQDTSPLEKGDSYNRGKMLDFAKEWRVK